MANNYFALSVMVHPSALKDEIKFRFERFNEIRDLGSACISVDRLCSRL